MPLFVCTRCKTIDNTALGYYWPTMLGGGEKPLCSECAPPDPYMGHGGRWHGKFLKRTATWELIKKIGREHFVGLERLPEDLLGKEENNG